MTTTQQPVATTVVKRSRQDEVKRDGVLKEQVQNEEKAKSLWNKKWQFLIDEAEKIYLEEAKKLGMSEEEFKNYRVTKAGKKKMKVDGWKFVPSEKIPVLSSGMIGWRSSRPECSLERFGPLYISPRLTIRPPDRPPTPPQQFIFLG